ncbi:hypothetical protein I7I51_04825 [Histoplasma capsulatum]|uniref:Uncharacterized protein n=1 Tax=Ajellomyces capsulatus TaxID=5037 RepID=A0A8A1M1S8_AJECA|nr:hypothetical protein I7I51_04825 [Histoplasma capsulatum]
MGITESKLLVASFSRACSEAETTDSPSQNILTDPLVQSQIKNILSDPRVASYATPIWKALPAVARNKITGRVVQDASHIDENFGDWASRGERLEGLTAACGGLDALFVLPGISDSDDYWEKTLPKSGEARDDMIATLHQRGVRRFVEELSDVSILEDVIGYIWPRLEEEITEAMKRHEESRSQHSAHLPTGDPNISHHGEPTAHAPTLNVDGSRPQLLVPQLDPVQNKIITSSATGAFDPINIDEMGPQISGQCFPGRSLRMIQHADIIESAQTPARSSMSLANPPSGLSVSGIITINKSRAASKVWELENRMYCPGWTWSPEMSIAFDNGKKILSKPESFEIVVLPDSLHRT